MRCSQVSIHHQQQTVSRRAHGVNESAKLLFPTLNFVISLQPGEHFFMLDFICNECWYQSKTDSQKQRQPLWPTGQSSPILKVQTQCFLPLSLLI